MRNETHGMGRFTSQEMPKKQQGCEHSITFAHQIPFKMATAISVGASFFLTNDTHLPSLPNLKTLVLEDLKKGSEG